MKYVTALIAPKLTIIVDAQSVRVCKVVVYNKVGSSEFRVDEVASVRSITWASRRNPPV
jgi:hypothetical protein